MKLCCASPGKDAAFITINSYVAASSADGQKPVVYQALRMKATTSVQDVRDTSDAEDDVEPSVTKLKERSSIWKYFRRATRSSAECDACKFVLQTPTGTTTPLVNHLKRHPALLKEYNDLQQKANAKASKRDQPTLKGLLRGTEPLPAKKRCALNSKLTAMVALDLQPYSIVEGRGFRELMSEAVPSYRLPCRSTLSRGMVARLYDDTRSKVKSKLKKALEGGHVSVAFTSDMWTSRANESYCWQHRSCIAGNVFRVGDPRRMGCVKFIVTDNGRNIRAAVRQLPWSERACFAHTLQLAINDSRACIPAVDQLSKRARHIVGHYKHSSSAQKQLDEYQPRKGQSVLRLVQDIVTRWNSQYLMLSRLLELKEAVTVELATSDSAIDGLAATEWKHASELVEALRPLFDATVTASTEQYPSLSSQIPMIFGILHCLDNMSDTSGFSKNFAKCIRVRFPVYDQDKEACLAMFLDPRFKSTIFKKDAHKLKWLEGLILDELNAHATWSELEGELTDFEQSANNVAATSSQVWNAFDNLANSDEVFEPDREIEGYANDVLLKRDLSPCQWWQTTG
ncbi:zinc finger BED domain-containing protein 4-like [Ornithodoros turicata]|uniref:zinc finger BED domain-containing protein 4-like n=1 Tax=Ornithodoros turicata TaxID=34597 RepID=UPI0031399C13